VADTVIVHLPGTTSSEISDRLVRLREEGGAVALGRVLTLVVQSPPDEVEAAIFAANEASREHPCRVVVVDTGRRPRGDGELDAEIRVGGDAGASEVVILRPSHVGLEDVDTLVIPLLLPDAPVVAWWTSEIPEAPALHPIGAMASRRITDALSCADPLDTLRRLRRSYAPGDTDLSWARCTMWRALVAATLDSPPYEPVTAVSVYGNATHPAPVLLAAWLAEGLRCPAKVVDAASPSSMTGVRLERRHGDVVLERTDGSAVATLAQPGRPVQRIVLPPRSVSDALAEELRRIDPDEIYGRTLTHGLNHVEMP
jgi:glucose-6-phosphate dehydrogenase assembly protein OpcA